MTTRSSYVLSAPICDGWPCGVRTLALYFLQTNWARLSLRVVYRIIHSSTALKTSYVRLALGIGICMAHTPSDVVAVNSTSPSEGKRSEIFAHGVDGRIPVWHY